jgi:AP-1 complex subunit mu
MRAHFGLPSVQAGKNTRIVFIVKKKKTCLIIYNIAEDTEKKPPINIKFEIPYFTVSGIQVRYLKIVEKSGYQALPWVRYITQNGGLFLK